VSRIASKKAILGCAGAAALAASKQGGLCTETGHGSVVIDMLLE